ncbi:ABC transporter permease [Ornithinibacillus bavariensis]|uniref:ABC transporter permease YtrF n=1 Tax=Ornithinibacillus bavariensis TaxID=545502 RepID=A0A920C723_9BACI|nr:FtsX-like permease family protein [Ornithinibacillus bavariensis]GIO27208.1 ABC transporter permease YtrF [Ornithinibacillus bavariensis]
MKLKDKYRFIRQNIKKNKARTFMTILATAMGCAFLIVLASVGYGLQQSVVKETLEDQVVTEINVHGKIKDDNYYPITNDEITFLEKVDHVKAVTRKKQLAQIPMFHLDKYQTESVAVSTHFPSEVKAGLKLEEGKLPENANEVVVGYQFIDTLMLGSEKDAFDEESGKVKDEYRYKDSLIGKTISMTIQKDVESDETMEIPLTIVGVLEKPTREWMVNQNVYISQEVFQEVEAYTGTPSGELGLDPEGLETTQSESYDEVYVYADNLEAVQGIVDTLEEEDYATYSVVSEMKQINTLFTIAKAGLIFVGTIALIIASIGIYNTMTMAVTERAPDIGIMKAIGANPKTIKQIFLLESCYIGIIGAFIGTLVAYVISVVVNLGLPVILEMAFDEEMPEGLQFSAIPWSLVLISVVICLIVTVISGMRPAKRATQIDVLKAMRREI